VTVSEWCRRAKVQLQGVGVPSAHLDSELLLSYALEKPRPWVIAHGNESLSSDATARADTLLERRLQREPLAYIRGWQEFYGRNFIVTPDVLIPRPESEGIIDLLKTLSQPLTGTLIDVGTGSGALGISAALEFPRMKVIASDIDAKAIKIAKSNSTALLAKVSFVQSDLLEHAPSERVEIIIANLPYVDQSWKRSPETTFEPSRALLAEDNGLALIFRLIKQAREKLVPRGYLLLEADPRQFAAIKIFATQHHFKVITIKGFILQLQNIG
jgi:release factor glutamine methyltransferase